MKARLSIILSGIFLLCWVSANAQLTTSISGVVWVEDKPLNGIRDASEAKLGAILVELYDTGDLLVGSAISGPDGSYTLNTVGGTYYIKYIFPTNGFTYAAERSGSDNTVNSAGVTATEQTANFTIASGASTSDYGLGLVPKPDTKTFCDSKELTGTDWSKTFSLPQSTLDVAKLTSAKLFTTEAVYHPSLGIESTNATPVTPTVEYKGRVSLTVPKLNGSGTDVLLTETFKTKTIPLGAYDGTNDFGGTSGQSYANEFASKYDDNRNYTALAARNLFTGAGQITFPATTTSVTSIIGAANINFTVSTQAAAGVCVVYTYTAGALPVTLVSLTAKPSETKTTKVEWATTAEKNSDHFEIQKSYTGKLWNKIGIVKSNGESNALLNYSFEDVNPANGDNLYRLKMIDTDGSFGYSRIVSVQFQGLPSIINAYPNPAVSELFIETNGDREIGKIKIFNNTGQLVREYNNSGNRIDVGSFSNGIYSIQATYKDGGRDLKRISVTH